MARDVARPPATAKAPEPPGDAMPSLLSRIADAGAAAARALLGFLQRRAQLPLVREVLGHWLAERRTLRQGLLALGLSTGVGMLAGLMLGAMEGVLADTPGLLVLVPAAIGMRGAIFGALGARLGTGMMTGQFQWRLRRGTFVSDNVEAAVVLTFVSAALAALFARATAAAFGLPTVSLWDLLVVSLVGSLLSSVVILAGVLALARTAFSRQWDMDAIGSPLITASGDVATLPGLVVATLLLGNATVAAVLGGLALAATVAVTYAGMRRSPALARTIVAQSLPVLAYASLVDVLAGTVLETRLSAFVDNPALLVLIPPFIATCGSLGGILAARLGSDLHLGLIRPRPLPERRAGLDASIAVLFAAVAFTGVGLVGHAVAGLTGLDSPGLGVVIAITLAGGTAATLLLVAAAYGTATATYHFGLDPDNYGIPIVTATMDLAGVLCLVGAIAALQVS